MTMKAIDPTKGIIVSFPRSGLNWVRYCIEGLTGQRTAGKKKLVSDGELAVYRTHYVNKSKGPDSTFCAFYGSSGESLHERVVLLLRDYRESFLRASKSWRGYQPSPEAIRRGEVFKFNRYFENLAAFDAFTGEKRLVRYSELIGDFSQVIGILDFLELNYNAADFDVESHRQRSLKIYDRQHKSFTKRNLHDFTWHQHQAERGVLEALDAFVDDNYRDLADRYLR